MSLFVQDLVCCRQKGPCVIFGPLTNSLHTNLFVRFFSELVSVGKYRFLRSLNKNKCFIFMQVFFCFNNSCLK